LRAVHMPELLICRNGTNSSEIVREIVGAQFRSLRHTLRFARVRWTTLAYVEKVRPQFLSLRHSYRQPDFSINEKAENLPIKGGFSRVATVLEIAEWRHFRLGDGIFLQSFVLRHFSIVLKGQGPERQLAAEVSWGSNLSRTSESNEARTELTGPGQFFQ
jgi:hypothetical protein